MKAEEVSVCEELFGFGWYFALVDEVEEVMYVVVYGWVIFVYWGLVLG